MAHPNKVSLVAVWMASFLLMRGCSLVMLEERDYTHTCQAIQREHDQWFLYTYRDYFDKTMTHSHYFHSDKGCIDGDHFCFRGRCKEIESNVSAAAAVFIPSQYGSIIVEVKDGFVKRDDGRSKADPYIQFKYGRKKYTTQVQRDTYNPVFGEEFVIQDFHIDENITVTVYDNDKIRDDHVGSFIISPKQVLQSGRNGQFIEYAFGPDKDYIRIKLFWQNK